jgi:hypothetical protein
VCPSNELPPGLKLIENFITEDVEQRLLQRISFEETASDSTGNITDRATFPRKCSSCPRDVKLLLKHGNKREFSLIQIIKKMFCFEFVCSALTVFSPFCFLQRVNRCTV